MKCPVCQHEIKGRFNHVIKCQSCQNNFTIKIHKLRFVLIMVLVLMLSSICDGICKVLNLPFIVQLIVLCLFLGLFFYIYKLTDMDAWIMSVEKAENERFHSKQ